MAYNVKKKRPVPVEIEISSEDEEEFIFEIDEAYSCINAMIEEELELEEVTETEVQEVDGESIAVAVAVEEPHPNVPMEDLVAVDTDDGTKSDSEADLLLLAKSMIKQLQKLMPTPAIIDSIMLLAAITDYIKLRTVYSKNKKTKSPWMTASQKVAARMAKGPYFSRRVRYATNYLQSHKCLPPYNRGKGARHASWLDNEQFTLKIKLWLAQQKIGEIRVKDLRQHFLDKILPLLTPDTAQRASMKIADSTIRRWLRKLGYEPHTHRKGLYVDGHERPDVKKKRVEYLDEIQRLER